MQVIMKLFHLKSFFCSSVPFVILLQMGTWQEATALPLTVTREYTYRASDADSKLSSRTIAMEQVKRLLLEELGTYLVSNTEVKNTALSKDEIVTYSAGWVATVVVKEVWNGEDYYLKAKITADTDEVAKAISLMHDDHDRAAELKQLRNQANDTLKEVQRLRKELAAIKLSTKSGTTAKVETIQKDYDKAVARLATNTEVTTVFDGHWAVSLHCDDFKILGHLTKGYTYNFFVDVKDGRLIGQYGQWAQPNSLLMIGEIQQDGIVKISAQGQTGTNPAYVGRYINKPYSYHMNGKFTQTNGTASRVELRPCDATFFKQ